MRERQAGLCCCLCLPGQSLPVTTVTDRPLERRIDSQHTTLEQYTSVVFASSPLKLSHTERPLVLIWMVS